MALAGNPEVGGSVTGALHVLCATRCMELCQWAALLKHVMCVLSFSWMILSWPMGGAVLPCLAVHRAGVG